MICLKVRDGETYDGIVDKINEMPAVKEALELEKVPDPSTLCKAFDRLLAAAWRVLLELTRRFFRLSGIIGMDSSGEERFKQFREELIKHLVYNIDRPLQLRLR
jgi:E3 ubiquitin-protein ligase DOA10